MKAFTVIALTFALALAALPAKAVSITRPGGAAEELTPEEEREAREFVALFVERFQEKHDLTPLVGELFADDFAAQVKKHLVKGADSETERRVFRQASERDLLRLCVAEMHFFSFGVYLRSEFELRRDETAAGYLEPGAADLLSPAGVELLRRHPKFRAMVYKELDLETDAPPSKEFTGATPEDDETGRAGVEAGDDSTGGWREFKNAEELRDFISILEQLDDLMRQHLAKQPLMARAEEDFARDENGSDIVEIKLVGAEEDADGVEKEKRILCVKGALMFHFDLERIGGRLKIVSISADLD
jgi:hypothetical protein